MLAAAVSGKDKVTEFLQEDEPSYPEFLEFFVENRFDHFNPRDERMYK
jgi:hypothetical protein